MIELLYVTLARAGSKGVPGKHTRLLGDRPVIEWTIKEVKKCANKGDYCISSDDQDVLYFAKRNRATAIVRPAIMCMDTSPSLEALQHAVSVMEKMYNKTYAYVVEVMATSPFKTFEDIDAAVDILKSRCVDSVIGVVPIQECHPARVKWLDSYGYIRDFITESQSGRRQDCIPPAYVRNGTIYALTRKALMDDNMRFGHTKSIGYVMPPERSVNIDTEMDWMLCKAILNG